MVQYELWLFFKVETRNFVQFDSAVMTQVLPFNIQDISCRDSNPKLFFYLQSLLQPMKNQTFLNVDSFDLIINRVTLVKLNI